MVVRNGIYFCEQKNKTYLVAMDACSQGWTDL